MFSKQNSFKGLLVLALSILFIFTSCEQPSNSPVLSSAALLTEFSIGDYQVSIDDTALTVSVPYGTTITGLTPTFTLSAGATSDPTSGSEMDFVSGTAQNITVKAEDGTSKIYTITVNVTAASTDSTIATSTLGNIVGNSITGIPAGTTLADFKAGIAVSATDTSSFEIYDADGTTVATELTSESKIVVTAQDECKSTYTVSLAVADRVVFTDVNYDFDGNIDDVIALVPTDNNNNTEITPTLMTGVITAKTSSSFTVQDQNAAIMVYGTTAEGVGTKVEIEVTEVKNYYDQYEVTKFNSVTQKSVNNDLYAQDAPTSLIDDVLTVVLDLATQNQLFKYDGYATGEASTTKFSKALFLDKPGAYYRNYSDSTELASNLEIYKGTFYGTSQVTGTEYLIAITTPDYFVLGETFTAQEMADKVTVDDPAIGVTELVLPQLPAGYTIELTTSNNASISSDGTITSGDNPVTGEVTLTVTKESDSSTAEVVVNLTVPVARDATNGTATDLFISEYAECAGGNNKAIEIANYTGAEVDLTNYKLVLFSNSNGADLSNPDNGGNTWAGTGVIANGAVHVNANSGADLITFDSTSEVNYFNGNDTVCLYVTEDSGVTWTLIDVVGPNDGTEFAADITLVRRPGKEGSTTYNQAGDWFAFPTNYFDDFGNHIY